MMIRSVFACTKTILTSNVVQSIPQTLSRSSSILHHYHLFSTQAEPPPLLIDDLCRALSDYSSPHHDIESALHPFAPNISPNLAEQVLKKCKNLGFSAHRFFIWAQNLPNFQHTQQSYRILVHILGTTKQFPLLWDFLAEMQRTQVFEITSDIFLLVFRAYSRANLPADAIRAYNKMVDYDIKPNIDDLNQLLFALCKRNHVKHAQDYFDKVKNEFVPSSKTYDILINGWGNVGGAGEARRMYDEMLHRGCSADLISFNSLLNCLCKAGNVDDAYKLFTGMESMGLKPDAYTLSIFIHAACEANDIHSVFKILDKMRRSNLVPHVFTYRNIIRTLCKSERSDDAYKLLNEMIERGVRPDVWCYNTILAFHVDHYEVNSALRLISRMDEEACLPFRQTYNTVLTMLIRMGRFDSAEEVWNRMEKRGLRPTVSSYAAMVHGFLKKEGKVGEACKYFEMMINGGLRPSASTCNVLRNTLIKLGFDDQTDILAEKMERSTSCSIQELSSVMRGHGIPVVSQNEEFYSGGDYSD